MHSLDTRSLIARASNRKLIGFFSAARLSAFDSRTKSIQRSRSAMIGGARIQSKKRSPLTDGAGIEAPCKNAGEWVRGGGTEGWKCRLLLLLERRMLRLFPIRRA